MEALQLRSCVRKMQREGGDGVWKLTVVELFMFPAWCRCELLQLVYVGLTLRKWLREGGRTPAS